MATALGRNEIQKVEDNTDSIYSLVNEWEELKSTIESTLNSEVGQKFTAHVTIGGTATNKIRKILDILIGMEERIHTLIKSTYSFCDEQRKANEQDIN